MARLINVFGTECEITPRNGKKFELYEVQELVGGYIQIIPLDHENVMVFDEDGKLKYRMANPKATMIAEKYNAIFPGDFIVGNVMICKCNEI